jgi:hypothetical protein
MYLRAKINAHLIEQKDAPATSTVRTFLTFVAKEINQNPQKYGCPPYLILNVEDVKLVIAGRARDFDQLLSDFSAIIVDRMVLVVSNRVKNELDWCYNKTYLENTISIITPLLGPYLQLAVRAKVTNSMWAEYPEGRQASAIIGYLNKNKPDIYQLYSYLKLILEDNIFPKHLSFRKAVTNLTVILPYEEGFGRARDAYSAQLMTKLNATTPITEVLLPIIADYVVEQPEREFKLKK